MRSFSVLEVLRKRRILGPRQKYRYSRLEIDKSPDALVQACLEHLGLSLLVEWDVLIFLYRHQAILTSAEQIARLLGYPSKAVGNALETLDSQKLVRRSRPSQGVRFYQSVYSEAHAKPENCFRQLIKFADDRSGRLLLVKHLRRTTA
jgi:DNA-binding MarR family transcriptional regulator